MSKYIGDFSVGQTIRFKFNTSGTLAGATLSVYKDSGSTEAVTGIVLTPDFDGVANCHQVVITTTADATLYSAGSEFEIVVTAGTVGGVSAIGEIVKTFSIANRSALRPTTPGVTLDVTAAGNAGIDWSNIESPSTTVNFSATTIKTATDVETDTADIQSRLPAALVSGRIDSSTGAMAADVLTASALATDAINEIQNGLATPTNITAGTITTVTNLTNAPTAGDLTAVMKTSVTTAATASTPVAASVTGSVGSIATDGITATSIATSALNGKGDWNIGKTGYALSAGGIQAIWDAATSALTSVGSIGKKLADWVIGTTQTGDSFARLGAPNTTSISADIQTRLPTASYTVPPTVLEIADQVWDELLSGHAISGSTGAGLTAAGAAGDPWSTLVPGAYGSGTAGHKVGNLPSADDVWGSSTRSLTDKTGFSLSQTFPTNFDTLGINSSGHISRVTLVDTTTTNTDMRGTDSAMLASSYVAPPSAATIAAAVDVALINTGDGTDLLQAIANQIAADWVAGDASPLAIVSALTSNATFIQLVTDATAAKVASESADSKLLGNIAAQTGDSFARLGTPNGASIAEDISTRLADTDYTEPPTIVEISNQITSDLATTHGSGLWTETDGLAILDKLDTMLVLDGSGYQLTANSLGLAPTGGLDAAGIRSAIGLATNDLDDQLDAILLGGGGGLITGSITIPFTSLPEITSTNEISLFKGTEWNFNVSGIGSNADDFYFTMKSVNSREDSEADLQISSNSGTIYINQTEYPTSSGSLTYSSGSLYISVEPEVTDMINGGRKYNWDIKGINETSIRSYGIIDVKTPTTRRIL